MKVSPACSLHYAKPQIKAKSLKINHAETPAPETVRPTFEGKPLTKIAGGLGALTAAIAIIGTGGAVAVILPALGFAATCTGVGYAMDKENEKNEEKNK